jgi:hypothetical protein
MMMLTGSPRSHHDGEGVDAIPDNTGKTYAAGRSESLDLRRVAEPLPTAVVT